MEILRVGLEMFSEIDDALGQQGDLNLRAAGISWSPSRIHQ